MQRMFVSALLKAYSAPIERYGRCLWRTNYNNAASGVIKRTPFPHESNDTSIRRGPIQPQLSTNASRNLFRPLSATPGQHRTNASHIHTQLVVSLGRRRGRVEEERRDQLTGRGGTLGRHRSDIYLEAAGSSHCCCRWDKTRRTISACDAVQRVDVFWRSRLFPQQSTSHLSQPRSPMRKKAKDP